MEWTPHETELGNHRVERKSERVGQVYGAGELDIKFLAITCQESDEWQLRIHQVREHAVEEGGSIFRARGGVNISFVKVFLYAYGYHMYPVCSRDRLERYS